MSNPSSLEKSPAESASSHTAVDPGEAQLLPPPELTVAQELTLYRKLDLRLMPIVSLMYLLASMDGANIGNAKIAGLTTQLHLVGDEYNLALTISAIPYCLCEFPANLLLQKFRPSRWLSGITMVWGIIMILTGLVKTYSQLVIARVFLDVVEAGLFPGVVYYMTLWYPRHALQYRIGLFVGSVSIALGLSGLLAFGIGFMNGIQGLEGWSWIFILEGIITVVAGILAALVLVDYPATASFLTPEERSYIVWKLRYDNSTVGEEEDFAIRYVWAAVLDWQVWLHILIYLSVVTPLIGIALFLPSIVEGFGYSTSVSQLLTAPVYGVGTVAALSFGYYSDKLRMRSPFIFAGLLLLLVGFSIEISAAPREVKYFGTYLCVSGGFGAVPGVVAWLGNNLAGQCKRGAGMAVQIGIGNFAALVAANIFRTQDAPRYIIGHAVELMFVGIGLITVPLTAILYTRINAQRDALACDSEKERHVYTVQELRDMGDRAPDFRYTT